MISLINNKLCHFLLFIFFGKLSLYIVSGLTLFLSVACCECHSSSLHWRRIKLYWSTDQIIWPTSVPILIGWNVGSNVWAFSGGRKFDGICTNSVIFKMLHLMFRETKDYVCVKKTRGWCKLKKYLLSCWNNLN